MHEMPTRGSRPSATTDASLPHSSAPLSPRARRFAEERNFHPQAVSGSGPGGRGSGSRPASPLSHFSKSLWRGKPAGARRVEAPLEGSGIGGIVVLSDLASDLASDLDAPETRISGVREKIASRMRESLASTAQYTLHSSADARGLLCCALVSRLRLRGQI